MKTGNRKKKTNEIDPYEIQGIELGRVKDKIAREDLLTEADFNQLLKACGENERDRAFIDVHTEAGTRPGETLSLRIKDVKTDEHGALINVIGKTNARPVRLIRSVPNLLKYLQNHPFRNDPDAALWYMIDPDDYGKPMTYNSARAMMLRRAKKAGLKKKIYLNLFRHSEATKMANFMTEAQLRKRHGWSPTSKMPSRYVHLVNSDVDNALFEHHGIKKKVEKQPDSPIKCQFCDMFNPHDSDTCSKCSKPLDLATAIKKDEKIQEEKEKMSKSLDDMKSRIIDLENENKFSNEERDHYLNRYARYKRDEDFGRLISKEDVEKKFPEKTSVRTAIKIKLIENGINCYPARIVQAGRYIEQFLSKKQITLEEMAIAFDLKPTKTILLPNRQPEVKGSLRGARSV